MRSRLVTLLANVGAYGLLVGRAVQALPELRRYPATLTRQMVNIGVNSLPVVLMAGAFSGIVLTVQTAYMLQNTVLTNNIIGSVVVPSILLELAGLTTGLVMASRVGASIAAELGSMRVSEQIDALEVMGINAVGYLVSPRVLAGFLMFPVLYVAAAGAGIGAGAMAGDVAGFLSFSAFIEGAQQFFVPFDAFFGMAKTAVFGFVITSISAWKGFTTGGGAEGVGGGATKAVVESCVVILFADYVMASLLL
jgi:phospholipid/cholesterol/gamma-HCH transport system permease protein